MTGAVDMRGTLPLRAGYTDATAYPQRTLDQLLWLVIHHEGTPDGSRGTIQQVAEYQIGPTAQDAFPGFAYTGYVTPTGQIQVAWNLEDTTWSQGDNSPTSIDGVGIYNYQGCAFCFAGNDPTPQQVTAYVTIKHALETILERSLVVRSHRDVCGTSDTDCAGDALETLIPEIQAA